MDYPNVTKKKDLKDKVIHYTDNSNGKELKLYASNTGNTFHNYYALYNLWSANNFMLPLVLGDYGITITGAEK
jgi:hypothetical protein